MRKMYEFEALIGKSKKNITDLNELNNKCGEQNCKLQIECEKN